VRALHYDNRADPSAFDSVLHSFAWNTHFDSAGLRVEGGNGWTVIAEWLQGETYNEPQDVYIGWPFHACFALLSKQLGPHRLSVRYDRFQVEREAPEGAGEQHGYAWTAAYVFEPGKHWRFTVEWLQVASNSANRALLLGEPGFARETQLQLAARYAIGSLER
jgi:hypothetical protein